MNRNYEKNIASAIRLALSLSKSVKSFKTASALFQIVSLSDLYLRKKNAIFLYGIHVFNISTHK